MRLVGAAPTPEVRAALTSMYRARLELALQTVAPMCGTSAEASLEHFRRASELFDGAADAAMEALAPLVCELVLTLASGARPSLGFLTQGRAGATLSDSLTSLLAAALTLHREGGGSAASAACVVELVRACFPEPASLGPFSPHAQAMIVGFSPQVPEALKLYFNTRLGGGSPHRDKVLRLAQLAGIDDEASVAGAYDALYDQGGASFHGVGIDVGRDQPRMKLYVRCPRASASELLARAHRYTGQDAGACQALLEQTLDELASPALVSELELGLSVRERGERSLKLTVFFDARSVSAADGERVARVLSRHGLTEQPARGLLESLGAGQPGAVQAHPLHGVGLELRPGRSLKLNLYAQPVI